MSELLRINQGGLEVTIKVIPKSSRNQINFDPQQIKLKITAPPVDGKANQAIVEFFSKKLHVSKSSISIIRGETSRTKTIRVEDFNIEQFLKAFGVS